MGSVRRPRLLTQARDLGVPTLPCDWWPPRWMGKLRIEVVSKDRGEHGERFGLSPGAAQPPADGALGNSEPTSDRSVPCALGVGEQRRADDIDLVSPPGQAPVGYQGCRRRAPRAASSTRSLPPFLSTGAAEPPVAPMPPRCQRGATTTLELTRPQRNLDSRQVVAHHHRNPDRHTTRRDRSGQHPGRSNGVIADVHRPYSHSMTPRPASVPSSAAHNMRPTEPGTSVPGTLWSASSLERCA